MEEAQKDIKPTEHFSYIGLGITLIVIVLVIAFVDMDNLKGWVEKAGVWAPLVFILLKASTLVVAPLSGSPLYLLVGLLFGFWPGILYIVLGDFLGYTLTFYISRIFGQRIVNKILSGKETGLLSRIVDHISDMKGFFHACLTLFAIPEVLSYGAGLSRLPYLKFISILVPMSAAAASILVFFGSLIDNQQSLLVSLGVPVVGMIIVVIGGTLFIRSVK
jgi:uncharacterized membrane protein YdjX (TVP38/TMEM64 family)